MIDIGTHGTIVLFVTKDKGVHMALMQSFWPVSHRDDDFWVCMSCLTEVFYRKVPMPDCPSCHGVSTYEGFTLEAIRDWGTEELIAKAVAAQEAAAVLNLPLKRLRRLKRRTNTNLTTDSSESSSAGIPSVPRSWPMEVRRTLGPCR